MSPPSAESACSAGDCCLEDDCGESEDEAVAGVRGRGEEREVVKGVCWGERGGRCEEMCVTTKSVLCGGGVSFPFSFSLSSSFSFSSFVSFSSCVSADNVCAEMFCCVLISDINRGVCCV